MNDPLNDSDQVLLIKKRARRRLIGAIVFAVSTAVLLPMVMDKEPPPATPQIELAIPAQEKGFVAPATGAGKASVGVAEPVPTGGGVPPSKTELPVEPPKPAPVAEAARLPEAKAPEAKVGEPKAVEIKPAKPEPAKAVKSEPVKVAKAEPVKPAKVDGDAKRAQALLDGKGAEGGDGPHIIQIGAYANPGNVQLIQKKAAELGIKIYTEALDSPQGKKTRVRAGPFPTRAAAEKAAARMKSVIGVGGVVAPKS